MLKVALIGDILVPRRVFMKDLVGKEPVHARS